MLRFRELGTASRMNPAPRGMDMSLSRAYSSG
jgi:hypothetical protein